jgi:hypothetical protein
MATCSGNITNDVVAMCTGQYGIPQVTLVVPGSFPDSRIPIAPLDYIFLTRTMRQAGLSTTARQGRPVPSAGPLVPVSQALNAHPSKVLWEH